MRFLFVIILIIGFLINCSNNKKKQHSTNKHKSNNLDFWAPKNFEKNLNFNLIDLKSKDVSLNSFKNKKIVLVNFWASWCSPCIEEIPTLINLKNKFKNQNFEILAISIDQVTDYPIVKNLAKTMKINFPILLDSKKIVAVKYKIQIVPVSYIIGYDGETKAKITGQIEWDDEKMVNLFKKLINSKNTK